MPDEGHVDQMKYISSVPVPRYILITEDHSFGFFERKVFYQKSSENFLKIEDE